MSTAGSVLVTPAATTTYTLTATGAGGTTTKQVTVTVTAAPPTAPTATFTASPTSITAGQSSTLTWTTTNATSVSIDNGLGAQPTSGSDTVAPTATTTYTLTATGAGGTTTKQATVTVTPATPAPSITFTASPTPITAGQSSTLSWSVTNATSVSIDNGLGPQPPTGSVSVSPTITTTYTLTATGAGGTTAKQVTVFVSAACIPPKITQVSASSTVAVGGVATLSVAASGSAVSYTWFLGAPGDTSHVVGTGQTIETGPLVNTTSFWVRASNSCGVDDSTAVIVSVCEPPRVTQQPRSTTVYVGQPVTLSVEASGSSVSFAWFEGQKGDTSRWVGTGQVFQSRPLARATSFWARASNECGVDDSSAAFVSVVSRRRAVSH